MQEEKRPPHLMYLGYEGRKRTTNNEVYPGSAYGKLCNLAGNETCTDEWK